MSAGFGQKPRRLASRLQPKTLRWRLALAACAASMLGVAVTFGLVHFATTARFNGMAADVAREQLVAFRAFIEAEEDDVAVHAAEIANSSLRHDGDPPTAGQTWIDERLTAAQTTLFVRTDASGRIKLSRGDAGELAAFRPLLSSPPARSGRGMAWTGRQIAVSSWSEVVDANGRSRGYVFLARPLAPAIRARFTPMTEGVAIALRPPAAIAVDANDGVAGFPRVHIDVSAGMSRSVVQLPGLLSASAGIAEIDLRDSRLQASMDAGKRATLIMVLVVGVLAIAFGLALGSAVGLPIDRTRKHLREQAPLALEGMACDSMALGPGTSSEFRDLASDVDGLLSALARRQAELVEATRQARAAQVSLRAALDGSPEGKLLVESGVVVLANRSAEEILRVPLDTLVGTPVRDLPQLVTGYDEDGSRLGIDEIAARVAEGSLVVRLDDPERWIDAAVIVLVPEPQQLLLSIRDVTEERRLDAVREEIFSMVSHDLRAPLTVIRGYLDILGRPLKPEARERALESARHNASKMAGLLDDLLDVTGADVLLAPRNPHPVDLAALASEVVGSVEDTSAGHRFEVVTGASPSVSGEERRLRQAVLNLVSNAVKYSPRGTTIRIVVSEADGHALLAVEDEGPGIPADSREAVFARYGRLPATADEKPGFGLGLYIVRTIAEKHGGRAYVEDAPTGGARVAIELPLAGQA